MNFSRMTEISILLLLSTGPFKLLAKSQADGRAGKRALWHLGKQTLGEKQRKIDKHKKTGRQTADRQANR